MDQYLDTAYTMTSQLFGADSTIPWWAWIVVIVALFWKVLIPEPQTTADRDELMLAALTEGMDGGSGKKKKGKKR
ncbi:hypothetical protein ACWKSP_28515 [Micromonosporaceae bacterium Da 78-11]